MRSLLPLLLLRPGRTASRPERAKTLLLAKTAHLLKLGSYLAICGLAVAPSFGEDGRSADLAESALTAAGGREKLFTRYRFVDRLRVNKNAAELFKPLDDRKPRVSLIEAPGLWWLEKNGAWAERGKEPAKWLAYGWTLAVLDDPKALIEPLADLVDPETQRTAAGLRVTGAVKPAMDLYFDKDSLKLVRIDWDDEICRFSEWKEFDGSVLATRCVGYQRDSGEPWYVCEIVEVERLAELPEGLVPPKD